MEKSYFLRYVFCFFQKPEDCPCPDEVLRNELVSRVERLKEELKKRDKEIKNRDEKNKKNRRRKFKTERGKF
jgi:hypothetical protein